MVPIIQTADILLFKGIPKAPEGSSKNKSDELMDTNEGKTYLRDMTKPVGNACRDDGTLKDADELEWPDSPTEITAPQNDWDQHDYEPAPHPEGKFDQRSRSSTPPQAEVTFINSEDEITIPQKRTKVSI